MKHAVLSGFVLAALSLGLPRDSASKILGVWLGYYPSGDTVCTIVLSFTRGGTLFDQAQSNCANVGTIRSTYKIDNRGHLLSTCVESSYSPGCSGEENDWGPIGWITDSEFYLGTITYDRQKLL